MRKLSLALLAAASLVGPSSVSAADLDYDFLRGPEYDAPVPVTAIDWSGVYLGGHGDYNSATADFKKAYQPLVKSITAFSTAESDFNASTLMSPRSKGASGIGFGGYVGYNYVFDDVIFSLEADYTQFDKAITTRDSISRFKTDSLGYLETVSLSGTANRQIEDYGTVRVRSGYAIDNFMPFITAGLAIGRVHVADSVAVKNYGYDQATYKANQALTTGTGSPAYVNNFGYASFSQTNPDASIPADAKIATSNKTKVVGGVVLGAGLEYALTSNIVLRAEYQYVMLNDFNANIKKVDGVDRTFGAVGQTSFNTVRGGAAVKF